MRMARDHWPPRTHVVDIGAPVDVVHARPLCALEKYGVAANTVECANRRVHTAWNMQAGPGNQFFAAVHRRIVWQTTLLFYGKVKESERYRIQKLDVHHLRLGL